MLISKNNNFINISQKNLRKFENLKPSNLKVVKMFALLNN